MSYLSIIIGIKTALFNAFTWTYVWKNLSEDIAYGDGYDERVFNTYMNVTTTAAYDTPNNEQESGLDADTEDLNSVCLTRLEACDMLVRACYNQSID